MKRFIFYTIVTGFSMAVCAQSDFIPVKQTPSTGTSELWHLNKYVWSQAHSTASKDNKPNLDFDAIDNWIGLGPNENLSITGDGQYFAYTIERGKNHKKDDILVVQSTNNTWRQSFSGAGPGLFSGNCKEYIFKDKQDLYFLPLGADQPHCVREVASYKLPANGKNEWLAFQLKNNEGTLVLQNILTDKKMSFNGVSSYGFDQGGQWLTLQLTNEFNELAIYNLVTGMERHFQSISGYSFDRSGKVLILKAVEKTAGEAITSLQYVSLPEGASKTIWSTTDSTVSLGNYSLDGSGRQVVFTVQTHRDNLADNSIWYYKSGMDKAVLKLSNQTTGIDAGLIIQSAATFTSNDHHVQFSLQQRPDSLVPLVGAASVDVWSYRDSILQSAQQHLLKETAKYVAVINPETEKVIRLEKGYEKLCLQDGDFALVKKSGGSTFGKPSVNGDRYWEKDYNKDSNWLVSLKDGSRTLLPTKGEEYNFWFSPGGRYLVYFDAARHCNYFSYDLQTGKLVNISAGVPLWQLGYEDPFLRPRQQPVQPVGVAGWLERDEGLLVYDNYDIWRLDLTGKKPPVNISKGYGRTHQILFTLMGSDRNRPSNQLVFSMNDTLLLRAFNRENKYNGFFRKILNSSAVPTLLYMGPYFMVAPCFIGCMYGGTLTDDGMKPLKAVNVNTWIIKRQSANEAPNYFVTHDFKIYKPLTDLQPQKRYNWVSAELHSFRQLDGTISQGVLYKPENFDPAKKYPAIISFYAQLSDQLYQYPTPEYIVASEIYSYPAWMVSHGYLVFLPDIYFTKNQWGPSTVNTIDGSARYLSTLPFVDSKHLGVCGHSNSGRFGYYLFTHSRSFASMSLSSGFTGTDVISLSLSLDYHEGTSNLKPAEKAALGTALGNLWQNKKRWIDHTAVLQADKATSPLLLLHNKNDGDDVRAAVELYISLRRLEKKAWWLQYDNGNHTLWKLEDQRDFTIRYTQFFDHYLKGAPAPRWMTEGIPFKLKRIESRYELDPDGWCGKNCPVCKSLHALKFDSTKSLSTSNKKEQQIKN